MVTHDGKEYSPFSPLPQQSGRKGWRFWRKANGLLMETPLVNAVEAGERITGYALDWPDGMDNPPRFTKTDESI